MSPTRVNEYYTCRFLLMNSKKKTRVGMDVVCGPFLEPCSCIGLRRESSRRIGPGSICLSVRPASFAPAPDAIYRSSALFIIERFLRHPLTECDSAVGILVYEGRWIYRKESDAATVLQG